MSRLTHVYSPASSLSKSDARDWSREIWREAFAMARRMIRDRATHGTGATYTWYLGHARRRFTTPTGWRVAQAAGSLVFDRCVVGRGASGSVEHLLRQG